MQNENFNLLQPKGLTAKKNVEKLNTRNSQGSMTCLSL